MTDAELAEIEANIAFAIAQMRHLYAQMASGHVRDMHAAANGLLSPEIARLETAVPRLAAALREARAKAERESDYAQRMVDAVVHYRNLAIALGAKPNDMHGAYDRKLCEEWDPAKDRGDGDVLGYLEDNREAWEEYDRVEAERDAAVAACYEARACERAAMDARALIVADRDRLADELREAQRLFREEEGESDLLRLTMLDAMKNRDRLAAENARLREEASAHHDDDASSLAEIVALRNEKTEALAGVDEIVRENRRLRADLDAMTRSRDAHEKARRAAERKLERAEYELGVLRAL